MNLSPKKQLNLYGLEKELNEFVQLFDNKKLPNNFQQIIVKISKSKEINLYDSKMKKLAKFKSFKEFIEEEI